MKYTKENRANRGMNGRYKPLLNETVTGSGAGRGTHLSGAFRKSAVQDVEQAERPAFFRPQIPSHQPVRGEAG